MKSYRILWAILTAITLVACEKNLIDANQQWEFVNQATNTNVKVINAYTFNNPAAPTGVPATRFYVYQNSTKLNGNAVSAAGAWPGPATYATVPSGKAFYSLILDRRVGNDYGQVQKGDTTFRTEYTLDAGKYYSVFMVDQFPKQTLLMTEDDMSIPTAGKYKIRVINLVPDPARPIDIYSRRAQTKIFTNLNYKDVKPFIELNLSAQAIADTIDVMEAGTTKPIYSSSTFTPVNGRIYTFYTFGRKGFATERLASYTNR
ncbi:DUF4397 domain-containing protein [Runella sp.]|jgi:hypothetical protein|uniref:DUF4397 domain-containing protein n=1 Tax=Runella sp. TaxID=1960881 RepID=UPI00261E78D3|nr:DUF4397 domain-containing protein [Runella sp.]